MKEVKGIEKRRRQFLDDLKNRRRYRELEESKKVEMTIYHMNIGGNTSSLPKFIELPTSSIINNNNNNNSNNIPNLLPKRNIDIKMKKISFGNILLC